MFDSPTLCNFIVHGGVETWRVCTWGISFLTTSYLYVWLPIVQYVPGYRTLTGLRFPMKYADVIEINTLGLSTQPVTRVCKSKDTGDPGGEMVIRYER